MIRLSKYILEAKERIYQVIKGERQVIYVKGRGRKNEETLLYDIVPRIDVCGYVYKPYEFGKPGSKAFTKLMDAVKYCLSKDSGMNFDHIEKMYLTKTGVSVEYAAGFDSVGFDIAFMEDGKPASVEFLEKV